MQTPPRTPGSVRSPSAPAADPSANPRGTARADAPPPPSPASQALARQIAEAVQAAGGWMGFEDYMARALYTPGLGYYSRGDRQFGTLATDGSDFVTAPELSPHFGRALAAQVAEALAATGVDEVWEFGAGSGALAAELLNGLAALGAAPRRYTIVDLSGTLRAKQQATLQARAPALADRVVWADALPAAMQGVVVGNELLDALPVALLHWDGAQWLERGVALAAKSRPAEPGASAAASPAADATPGFVWADRPTTLRPPLDPGFPPGATVELARQATAWLASLGERLQRGAAFLIDYGFPEAEFFHPQRHAGTLMCHRAHRADPDPLDAPGDKDITAHVDFTAVAVAAQDAGFEVLGYTSQARFLINCGLLDLLPQGADLPALAARAAAARLVNEHEMGELFKVIGLVKAPPGPVFDARGFRAGDRSHRL
ncbi:class I SAM-dependent methyltransferase [Aquariibacter albus]|uniref:SAM-dependent methyltransferase n=1 Tax=Aquariibacter albus TaxID=2759899 RepID=A0A839HV67_9BURK|nr:SAM-dependent methyltransferase [Aquariibacter albus]